MDLQGSVEIFDENTELCLYYCQYLEYKVVIQPEIRYKLAKFLQCSRNKVSNVIRFTLKLLL